MLWRGLCGGAAGGPRDRSRCLAGGWGNEKFLVFAGTHAPRPCYWRDLTAREYFADVRGVIQRDHPLPFERVESLLETQSIGDLPCVVDSRVAACVGWIAVEKRLGSIVEAEELFPVQLFNRGTIEPYAELPDDLEVRLARVFRAVCRCAERV